MKSLLTQSAMCHQKFHDKILDVVEALNARSKVGGGAMSNQQQASDEDGVAPRSNEPSANLNVNFEAGRETCDAKPCRPGSRGQ